MFTGMRSVAVAARHDGRNASGIGNCLRESPRMFEDGCAATFPAARRTGPDPAAHAVTVETLRPGWRPADSG